MVRELLLGAGHEELVEPAILLVSEAVTNALLHAGTSIEVAAAMDPQGLHVEVADGSTHLPTRRRYGSSAGTGRGLTMLERLADDWGVRRTRRGKKVWFRLATGEAPAGPAPPEPPERARRTAASVAVQLRNMPLLLHGAWQEHAETLLREYLLTRLEEGDDPIQEHAEATDAIAVLEEHVPRAPFAIRPDRLMVDATEPRVTAAVVEVPVPRASVPHFATLQRTMDEAIALSQSGQGLTPPTPPEVQAFRRWVCGQVLEQAAGSPPVAWSMETGLPPWPVAEPDSNLMGIRGASVPMVGADETNRIVAVSPAALDLLGYAEPDQLAGRRILEIIPPRLRQAHVAGFTLFLLVGRRPLVDTTVVVPALRRDGSEVLVELTVTVRPAGDGRSVFVAELRPAGG